ncbi:hypothetical protein AB3N60_16955 [Leptospira sp. WS39.C2]
MDKDNKQNSISLTMRETATLLVAIDRVQVQADTQLEKLKETQGLNEDHVRYVEKGILDTKKTLSSITDKINGLHVNLKLDNGGFINFLHKFFQKRNKTPKS